MSNARRGCEDESVSVCACLRKDRDDECVCACVCGDERHSEGFIAKIERD